MVTFFLFSLEKKSSFGKKSLLLFSLCLSAAAPALHPVPPCVAALRSLPLLSPSATSASLSLLFVLRASVSPTAKLWTIKLRF